MDSPITSMTLGYAVILFTGAATASLGYFTYPLLEKIFQGTIRNYVDWVVTTQDRMFRPVSRTKVTMAIALSTSFMAILSYLFSRGYGWVTFLFTFFFACIGWLIPRFWVSICWQRRLIRFDEQLVDGLNLMANSLKSGLNLPQVIDVLVQEMPDPISQEFGLVVSQQKLGLTVDEALEKMLERIPSEDLNLAVHAVLILRETGGDLSETFEVISNTIRQRRKVDGKIKAMVQQGKTQGFLLLLMPFGLGLLLYFLNPGFLEPLFTTRLGWMMIIAMLFFQTLGALWIRKIIKIDV